MFLLLCVAGWMNRNQHDVIEYLQEEVRVMREMLGKKPRFSDDQRRRLVAQKYDSSKVRKPGRPKTKAEIQELILKFARESRTWGYTRIQGALANLRHEISRGTIANVLKVAGLEPAPARRNGMTWKEFLKTHWEVLAATDFFTVEVWTGRGLVEF